MVEEAYRRVEWCAVNIGAELLRLAPGGSAVRWVAGSWERIPGTASHRFARESGWFTSYDHALAFLGAADAIRKAIGHKTTPGDPAIRCYRWTRAESGPAVESLRCETETRIPHTRADRERDLRQPFDQWFRPQGGR